MPKVLIRNPFAVKESLAVALEVTSPLLNTGQYKILKKFRLDIPCELRTVKMEITDEIQESIINCIETFETTNTSSWIRIDLLEALLEFKYYCTIAKV